MNIIDLRSDTVTQPTNKMRNTMMHVKVGDDVMKEDPTIQLLEQIISEIFHKESALFFPSGTMSNLTAILTWCNSRGSEIIVGDKSHIFLFEQSGASQFGGISFRTVKNETDGTMNLKDIELAVRENDIHEPITQLICIENTHNVCGGTVLPLLFMKDLKKFATKNDVNIPIHLDGARVWNAITELNIEPHEISNYVDSLTVCLSKGLGAPVGSVLVGNSIFIEKARRIRKALGGGMRQAGVLAGAGIEAIIDFYSGMLKTDHIHTQMVANELLKMPAFKMTNKIQTNIIFVEIIVYDKKWEKKNISTIVASLFKDKNILVSVWSPVLLRFVFHRDIKKTDILHIINTLKEVSDVLCSYT
jgi:threonine aldolase